MASAKGVLRRLPATTLSDCKYKRASVYSASVVQLNTQPRRNSSPWYLVHGRDSLNTPSFCFFLVPQKMEKS